MTSTDLKGAYEALTHFAVGQSLHAPGSVHILSHEEATSLLEAGSVARARSKRGPYELPTLAEYVSAGFPAHYYALFIKNETDDVPFDSVDAFHEGKAAAAAPPEWHALARTEGRTATIGAEEPEPAPPAPVAEAEAAPEPAPVADDTSKKQQQRRKGGDFNPNRAGNR